MDPWINRLQVSGPIRNSGLHTVADFIDNVDRKWKVYTLLSTFAEEDVNRIVRIPLAPTAHVDFMVWKGEATGDFTARSAYRLLLASDSDGITNEVQDELLPFYKKLEFKYA